MTNHTIGNIHFGPMTMPYNPNYYGPMNPIDHATMILTPAQEKEIEDMMNARKKKTAVKDVPLWKPVVGKPIYINSYRMRDGKLFKGWGICLESSSQTDYVTAQVWYDGGGVVISTTNFSQYETEPERNLKETSFIDADGNNVKVSYGEYETEDGIEKIFGIDSPYETVSFVLNDLSTLINAIQKVRL